MGQISLGAPAEHTFGSRTVGSDVAYVAEAVLAGHHRCRPIQATAQLGGHLADGHHPRRADVQRRQSYREPGVKCREHRSRHVRYVDEVAALAAVLEHARRLATQQTVGEDRRNPGVPGVPRHTKPVHVVEPECGDGPSGLPAPYCRQLLPVRLCCRIGVARIERRRLGDQFRNQIISAGRA